MGIIKETLYKISNKRLLAFLKNQTIYPYYHIVRDDQVAHIENLYVYKNIELFKKDLEVLSRNYTPIHPKELLENQSRKNTFLISFDDGLQEIYSEVYPILKEKKIPAVFFINPDFVDNKNALYKHWISILINHLKRIGFDKDIMDKISRVFYFKYSSESEFIKNFKNIPFNKHEKITEVFKILNFDPKAYLNEHPIYITTSQIQEMMNDGFYFGGHTMSHPPLKELTFEEQKAQIIDSIEWLKKNCGVDYSLFAFPFSDKNISKQLIQELFEYDEKILIFGNSGIKKDMDKRIIQRISFENPTKEVTKHIVTENLYKYFNLITSKYQIKRK